MSDTIEQSHLEDAYESGYEVGYRKGYERAIEEFTNSEKTSLGWTKAERDKILAERDKILSEILNKEKQNEL
jgi:hypothetical protein